MTEVLDQLSRIDIRLPQALHGESKTIEYLIRKIKPRINTVIFRLDRLIELGYVLQTENTYVITDIGLVILEDFISDDKYSVINIVLRYILAPFLVAIWLYILGLVR